MEYLQGDHHLSIAVYKKIKNKKQQSKTQWFTTMIFHDFRVLGLDGFSWANFACWGPSCGCSLMVAKAGGS